MIPSSDFAGDPALPGLAAIRAAGLAGAVPALLRDDGPVELLMWRGYTRGTRATLEALLGSRRLAVKAYSQDPSAEASLYEALHETLPADSGVRAPRVIARASELNLLVLGWIEGPTARDLLIRGQGKRAGELASRWLRRSAALSVELGARIGIPQLVKTASRCAAALTRVDPTLGRTAIALVGMLEIGPPDDGIERLVHGNYTTRHVLDADGDAVVLDWSQFGRGPLEIDAGVFLSTLERTALAHRSLARDASQAEEAFRSGTSGLLNDRLLAWHSAAALLGQAQEALGRRGEGLPIARALLDAGMSRIA